jgi:hypothetical protein
MYGRWPDYVTESPYFPPASAEWLVAKGPKSIGPTSALSRRGA